MRDSELIANPSLIDSLTNLLKESLLPIYRGLSIISSKPNPENRQTRPVLCRNGKARCLAYFCSWNVLYHRATTASRYTADLSS
jgi:hypothetical protein